MGQADIAYMIKRIYEKYNATQEGKKYEDRVYMGEDEFQYNLEEMVKKSPIDDKALLYKEIYRNISENALEIDSNGAITISPKLIIEVEKEIQLQQEREQVLENESQTVNNNIPEIMSEDDYANLSEEEKDEIFIESLGWIFETPEEAKQARENMEALSVDTTVDATEILKKKNRGEPVSDVELKTVMGTNSLPKKPKMELNMLKWSVLLQNVTKSGKYNAFFIDRNGKKEINVPLLEFLGDAIQREGFQAGDVEKIIVDSFKTLIVKDTSVRMPEKEEIEEIKKLFEDKNRFEILVKGLSIMGKTDKLYKQNIGQELSGLFEQVMTEAQVIKDFDGFIGGIASIFGVKEDIEKNIPNFFSRFERDAVYGINKWDNALDGITTMMDQSFLQYNATSISKSAIDGEILQTPVIDVNVPQGDFGDITQKGRIVNVGDHSINGGDYEKKNISMNNGVMTPEQITAAAEKFLADNAGSIPGILKKPIIEEPSMKDFIVKEPIVEFETDFDAALMSITDAGDDMFAAMFGDMAEEMVVGGSEVEKTPEVELELEPEEEIILDAPPVVNNASGIIAEDMTVGETSQEFESPEESKSEQNAMVVDTTANKIKRSLIEFGKTIGKAVKGVFGKIANAFNGGNNSESNNTGSNGGGVTQEPKDSQIHTDVNFIPQATLNFDFLKAGNEDKKMDPTQARDGKGEDTEIVD